MTIRALVFDLAGVLLDFGGPQSVHKLSDGRVGNEEFFRFWSDATCAHDFHCGRCTPEEFAPQAVREFGLRVTAEQFLPRRAGTSGKPAAEISCRVPQ